MSADQNILVNRSGVLTRVLHLVVFCATLLMFAGAAHATAHKHDQRPDFDGECIVCTVAASHVVKISPDDYSIREPENLLNPINWVEYRFVVGSFNGKRSYARGPPQLFIQSN